MTQLIDKFNIDVFKLPVDKNGKHRKDFWDDNSKKPLSKSQQNKYYSLLKKIFRYMDKKGTSYCNKFTLEQIALQIISLDDIRFIEFCLVTLILFVYLILLLPKLIFKMNCLTVKIFLFLKMDIVKFLMLFIILLKMISN